MNTAPQPSAISHASDRLKCADQLDKVLLALTPEAATDFIVRWGEGLRTHLMEPPPYDNYDFWED